MEVDLQHWDLVEGWFNDYISSFGAVKNQTRYMFDLKKNHSYRVSEIMLSLARTSQLSASEVILARIIGLVHDIGRFPQYIKFHTFNDHLSVDHGQLAVDVLIEKKILTSFSKEIQNIIKNAIFNHNKEIIDKKLTNKERAQAELIRDADKLDILGLACPVFEEGGEDMVDKLLLSWSPDHTITPDVARLFLSGTTVNHSELRTIEDYKISLMAWIYDFNNPAAVQMFKENKYLQRIGVTLPTGPIKNTIKKKITHLMNI